jgi:hypothetical protein
MDVMATIKGRENCSGIFRKVKVTVAFLKYAKIAVASIKLTLAATGTGDLQPDHYYFSLRLINIASDLSKKTNGSTDRLMFLMVVLIFLVIS